MTDPDSRLSFEDLLKRLRSVQYILNDVQYQLHDIETAVAAEVKRRCEEQKARGQGAEVLRIAKR